jgi:hypothetical protein
VAHETLPSKARLRRGRLVAALIAVVLTWGGAALAAWYTWGSAADFWAGFGRAVPAGLRGADDRLFLEDTVVMSSALALALGLVILLAHRRPGQAVVATWVLAAMGAVLWLGPIASVPQAKDAYVDCAAAHSAQGADVRGWSWTRFGAVVVVTGAGPAHEVVCR